MLCHFLLSLGRLYTFYYLFEVSHKFRVVFWGCKGRKVVSMAIRVSS
jgi:hypothetical protein